MGISRDKAHKRRATGGKHKRIRMKRKFEMGRQPANTKIGEKKITRIRVRGGNYKFRALRLDHGNYSWTGEAVTRKTRILKVVYNSTNNELVRTNTLVKGSIIQIDSTPFKAWYLQYYNIDLSNKQEIQAAIDKSLKDVKEDTATATKEKGKKPEKPKKEEKGAAKKEESSKPKAKAEEKPKKEEKARTEPKKTEKGKKEEKPKAEKPKEPKAKETTAKETTAKGKSTTVSTKAKSKTQEVTRKVYSNRALKKFEKRNSRRLLEPGLGDQFKTGRLYAKITSRPGQSGRCDGYILEGEELAFYLKKINLKKKK